MSDLEAGRARAPTGGDGLRSDPRVRSGPELPAGPSSLPTELSRLQRQAGNGAVARLLSPVRALPTAVGTSVAVQRDAVVDDPRALQILTTEELIRLYLSTASRVPVRGDAVFTADWVGSRAGGHRLQHEIRVRLDTKRHNNEIDALDWFLSVARSNGGSHPPERAAWVIAAIRYRIRQTEQDQAADVAAGAALVASVDPRPVVSAIQSRMTPFSAGLYEGLRRSLPYADWARIMRDTGTAVQLAQLPFTAGVVVGLAESVNPIWIAYQMLDGAPQMWEIAAALVGPQGGEAAYLLGLEFGREEVAGLEEDLTGSPTSVAFNLGRMAAPLILDILIWLIGEGAVSAARRSTETAGWARKIARRLRPSPAGDRPPRSIFEFPATRRLRDATPPPLISESEGAALALGVRRQLSRRAGGGNVVVARSDIGGTVEDHWAVAGSRYPEIDPEALPAEHAGRLGAHPTPAGPELLSGDLPESAPGLRHVDSDETSERALDAERKLLDHYFATTSEETRGRITLYTERTMCGQCNQYVERFRRERPGIIIDVIGAGERGSPIPGDARVNSGLSGFPYSDDGE